MARVADDTVEPMGVITVTGLVGDRDPRRSRRAGSVLLILGLLAVLFSRAAVGFTVRGHPAAQPLPTAPPVGSCLLIDGDSTLLTACADDHNAEVVQSWDAGAAPAAAPPFAEIGTTGSAGACVWAQTKYLHPSGTDVSGEWTIAKPTVRSRLIAAPPGQRSGGAGWTACIIESPHAQTFTGSVRSHVRPLPSWPSLFASCVVDRTAGDLTDCTGRHRIEVLGWFSAAAVIGQDGLYTGPIEGTELQRTCTDLIATMTGATDPTYGGTLRIVARPLFPTWAYTILTRADTGQVVATAQPRPLCYVEVDATTLTGTVIGLGDNPLPLT